MMRLLNKKQDGLVAASRDWHTDKPLTNVISPHISETHNKQHLNVLGEPGLHVHNVGSWSTNDGRVPNWPTPQAGKKQTNKLLVTRPICTLGPWGV